MSVTTDGSDPTIVPAPHKVGRFLVPAIFLAGLAAATMSANAALAADVTGLWHTDGGGVVEIRACAESVCGRLMSTPGLIKDPSQRDVANQDVALRGRPLAGVVFLSGFRRSGDSWIDGSIYDPNSGSTHSASLKLADANALTVSACIVYILCKSFTWVRAK